MGLLDRLGQRLLFALDPETAHKLAIRGLSLALHPTAPKPDPRLRTRVFDLDFPSPVGLAAGFDKNAVAVDGLLKLGFGFVEVGTITPRPQPGNPPPRLFRLQGDRAIINRMGFNNDGLDAALRRLRARGNRPGIVGVNLGANKDSADRIADYVEGVTTMAGVASYLVINVSSPNTPGLRDLQVAEVLTELVQKVRAALLTATEGRRRPPLLVKLAPDLAEPDLPAIAAAVSDGKADGIIVSNTTLSRAGLRSDPKTAEAGGLSGPPLFRRSTALLAKVRRLVGPELPLIGAGGVDSGETAWAKLAAGANLVQVYTGMIYEGQGIAAAINRDLARRLTEAGMASIADVVGTDVNRWAAQAI
ncbi:MAG: quinone-dependent dihydroorotate dehydrogenase [Bauldia sp.]|nr:quinone-dependent dihydroorotate dehydrogenase [Bauldia sp.]